jgi:pyrimidine deaminase RibD-like protein
VAAVADSSTRYGADRRWLELACELAALCPPSQTAYSVGAVIVDGAGRELARGHSREGDPVEHAEEAALGRLQPGTDLSGATIYTSLEPCGGRASRPEPCARLIVAAGIPRVVYAWREPPLFADGEGTEQLRAAGAEVIELPDLAGRARAPNAHLLR